MANSKATNTIRHKRKYNNVKEAKAASTGTARNVPKADNTTTSEDMEGNEAATSNSSESSEAPLSPGSTS